jgi:hypothetical protein
MFGASECTASVARASALSLESSERRSDGALASRDDAFEEQLASIAVE